MSFRLRVRRWAAVSALVSFGFSSGFLINETVGFRRKSTSRTVHTASAPHAGTQLLAIFAASSTCGASRYPSLPEELRAIRKVLAADAQRNNRIFVSVGLSVDQDPWVGAEFMKQFGPFDEILSGRGWLNTGAIAFIVRDMPAQRAIPQLILVERDVQVDDLSISEVHDRLVGRKIGSDQIVSYAKLLRSAPSGRAIADVGPMSR